MTEVKRWLSIRISGDTDRLKELIERAVAMGMPSGDDAKEGPVKELYLDGSRLVVAFGRASQWERCRAICTLMSVGRELKVSTVSIEWPDANAWLKELGIREKDGLCQPESAENDFGGI